MQNETLILKFTPDQGVLEAINFFRSNRNYICFGFFRFAPKQTGTQSVSVVFRFVLRNQKMFSGLFRCFRPVSKQPKQTELFRNKPKKSPKTLFIRVSSIQIICFRFEPKQTETQSVSVGFWCVLKPKILLFFGLFWCFGTTETIETYGTGN